MLLLFLDLAVPCRVDHPHIEPVDALDTPVEYVCIYDILWNHPKLLSPKLDAVF